MPGRTISLASYRYGFNGKENDNEVKGTGNQQDYGMRIFDPRLGRFLSVDPITRDYPWYTPYQFAGNTPVQAIDLDGLEPYYTNPTQVFYEGSADKTRAFARFYDNYIGYFLNVGVSFEKEQTKSQSRVTTVELKAEVKGNLESWVLSGNNNSNQMPKLKLADFATVQFQVGMKQEKKTKAQAGNVSTETKVNVQDGSTETKVSYILPPNPITKVPLNFSTTTSQNTTTQTTKAKTELKTDTNPSTGASIELEKDKDGNTKTKVGIAWSAEAKKGNSKVKVTATIGKTFQQ